MRDTVTLRADVPPENPAHSQDLRSVGELAGQALGAIIVIAGCAIATKQLIYKQFNPQHPKAEFRTQMLRALGFAALGIGIIVLAAYLGARSRN